MNDQFNDAELRAIRQFYEEELVQTVARYQHLTSVLDKLGVNSPGLGMSVSLASSEGGVPAPAPIPPKPVSAAPRKRRKGKRGRKPIWAAYILKTLKEFDRPIMYQEMVRSAQIAFNVKDENLKELKAAVNQASFRLRTVHGKIDSIGQKGRKEKYLVLKSWYGEGDKLEKKYADMCVFGD